EVLPALFERYDRDMGELFTRPGAVRDEIFSQRYRLRSLEHEQERVVIEFWSDLETSISPGVMGGLDGCIESIYVTCH
ncbi:hypothetical protein Tco_0419985, partial [Tanacetum coccineum]